MQVLVVAKGIEIPIAPKAQIASVRACVEQLQRDPRVRSIWGFTGHSLGCCLVTDVPSYQEADRLAGFLQVSGLPDVQLYPLVPGEQLQVGLEEAEAITSPAPAPRRRGQAPQAE